MCRVRLKGSGIMEVFPSITSDDVAEVDLRNFEEGDELDLDLVDVSDYAVVFSMTDGRSSSLPLAAIDVVSDCGDALCDLSA